MKLLILGPVLRGRFGPRRVGSGDFEKATVTGFEATVYFHEHRPDCYDCR